MKLICDCGAITEFVTGGDGESFTESEGWYKIKKGSMEICKNYYQVFFACEECGSQIWIFI